MNIESYWQAHTQIPGFEKFPPEARRLIRRMFYSGFVCALTEWYKSEGDLDAQLQLFDEWRQYEADLESG